MVVLKALLIHCVEILCTRIWTEPSIISLFPPIPPSKTAGNQATTISFRYFVKKKIRAESNFYWGDDDDVSVELDCQQESSWEIFSNQSAIGEESRVLGSTFVLHLNQLKYCPPKWFQKWSQGLFLVARLRSASRRFFFCWPAKQVSIVNRLCLLSPFSA